MMIDKLIETNCKKLIRRSDLDLNPIDQSIILKFYLGKR